MKYPTLLLILLVSGLPGCLVKEAEPETEIEKLPRATKEGRYTFGCLIDGKAYVSDYSTDAYAIFQGNLMFIAGVFTTHGSISFSIDFTKTNVGVYWIDQSTAKLHRASYSTPEFKRWSLSLRHNDG